MMPVQLNRLEDNLWSLPSAPYFKEIRISHDSPLSDPTINFKLVQIAAKALLNHDFSKARCWPRLHIKVSNNDPLLNGTWKVYLLNKHSNWLLKKIEDIKNSIPFFYKVETNSIQSFKIISVSARKTAAFVINEPVEDLQFFPPLSPYVSREERIAALPFSDPFTKLAAETLQTIEKPFVYDLKIKGQHRLVLDGNTLSIERIHCHDTSFDNRPTVEAYYTFIKEEYGEDVIAVIEKSFDFTFKEMLKNNSPLLPDLVFKINIGVNDIRYDSIQTLYEKLKKQAKNPLKENHNLSFREIRGLERLKDEDQTVLLNFIKDESSPKNVKDLPVNIFNNLVSILMVPDSLRDNIYTGRKVTHLAICGYPTMGDSSQWDPSRDLHELLQTFPDMVNCKTDQSYYELLSHVAVKKHLFRKFPDPENSKKELWKVGLLIPAPNDPSGNPQWYTVSSILDDGKGNFNYTLEPACNDYKTQAGTPLPFIKLYRSTASDGNAVNSEDTIIANANPIGSPGPIDPDGAAKYENPAFDNRTIPLWVGYLLSAKKCFEVQNCAINDVSDQLFKLFEYFPKNNTTLKLKVDGLRILYHEAIIEESRDKIEKILNSLNKIADDLKELPEYKSPQDIVFLGHSLGGALAQKGLYLQSADRQRIPCPNCNFILHAFASPAVDEDDDVSFMSYGLNHRDLIQHLGQKWRIHHRLEYGDFIPSSGQYHLGTTNYNTDTTPEWLDFSAEIFRALPTATAKEITTMPTHGRRIGLAQEGLDYSVEKLSPQELHDFHSWWLKKDLRQKFGYRLFVSPKITEIARRSIGALSFGYLHLKNIIKDRITPPLGNRDKKGRWFISLWNNIPNPNYA